MCHRHCFFLDTHTHSLSFCIGFSQQPDSRWSVFIFPTFDNSPLPDWYIWVVYCWQMCWQTYCCHCSLFLSAGWVPAADCWSCLGGTSRESLTSSSHPHPHSPTPSPLADQIQAWYTTDLKRLEGTFCTRLSIKGLLFRGKVCRTVSLELSLICLLPLNRWFQG